MQALASQILEPFYDLVPWIPLSQPQAPPFDEAAERHERIGKQQDDPHIGTQQLSTKRLCAVDPSSRSRVVQMIDEVGSYTAREAQQLVGIANSS